MAEATSKKEATDRPCYHFMVVVLGDLGRSPRMQYHVLSLLQAGHFVTFVGYTGEALIPSLLKYAPPGSRGVKALPAGAATANKKKNPSQLLTTLQVVRFPTPKVRFLKSTPWLLPVYFIVRMISLALLLCAALFFVKPAPPLMPSQSKKKDVPPQIILMQNPPAIPVLFIMAFYKYWTGARLVIDWHNLGYSMVDQQYTTFRALGRWYEQTLAPYADGHLTVTRALQAFLKDGLNGLSVPSDNISVLYDCPPSIFRLRTIAEQHQILARNQAALLQVLTKAKVTWPEVAMLQDAASQATLLTEPLPGRPGKFQPRSQRPALLVSSTSWTKDEDMGILIDALQAVDKQIQDAKSSLRIMCAITGKGPLKAHYEKVIAEKTWKSVVVATLWMEPADYPTFLATADVGISLHTSTSGMDLPIKILDYFGCEVPVCAYRFPCLHELVQDDVNGRTFEKPDELATILLALLEPLATAKPAERLGCHGFGDLQRYSRQIQGQLLWSENWPKNAWPVLERALENAPKKKSKDD